MSAQAPTNGTHQAQPNVPENMRQIKAWYSASQPSTFRRTRTGIGGSADAHLSRFYHYYTIREYARDMDRNDAIFGQLVDRAADNIGCMSPQPDTGTPELDTLLRDKWKSWSEDAALCDDARRHAFPEMERLILRSLFVDGDIFVLPLDSGTIQVVEADMVDSPNDMDGKTIHGVQRDGRGRTIKYWFKEETDSERVSIGARRGFTYDKRAAYNSDGQANVLHIFDPRRFSQTRGISAFAPVLDISGQFEDLNFAVLVKQQVASCIAAFITASSDIALGSRTQGLKNDLEELTPGLIARLRPGEAVTAFSPSVPAAEYFDQVRLLLRIIGCNLGMPLTLALLDTTNTTFHGYRGELQQARIGFERIRAMLTRRFHSPVWRFKVRQWLAEAGITPPESNDDPIYKHGWTGRAWPYVDPQTDVSADKLRVDNLFISPSDLVAERGETWGDVVRETVEDRTLQVRSAIEAAQAITDATGTPVTWRELLNFSTPAGVQGATTTPPKQAGDGTAVEEVKPGADAPPSSDKGGTKQRERSK